MAAAKAAGDDWAAAMFNGKQNAYKITMNSVYGFLGATKGMLPCVPIAASVTATGRAMIQQTKHLAETLVPGSRVIYGDTDSVMVIFDVGDDKRHDMHAHFEVAARVAAQISATFKAPNELEFEKCYYPYLLFSKKRYAGLMYTKPEAPDYIDTKGIQLVRRDSCPLVKEVSQAVLDAIMHRKDTQAALQAAREHVAAVLAGRHAIDKFVVSKALRGDYKNDKQPHLYVAKKLARRRGHAVPSGTRVPYVFVEDMDDPECLQAERAEDPAYARDHDLPLDLLYYVEHQLASPVCALLDVLVDDAETEVFGHDSVKPLLDALRERRAVAVKRCRRLRKNAAARQPEITSFFKPLV